MILGSELELKKVQTAAPKHLGEEATVLRVGSTHPLQKQSQGSRITINLLYVITYVGQNFGVRDVRRQRQVPKSMY